MMDRRIIRVALLAIGLTAAPLPAAAMDPIYSYAGINVGVISNTKMVIEPFSMWMWGPVPGWDGRLIEFTNTVYPDLTTIGLNGMDVNPNGAGNMPPDGAYDLFAFYNPTTSDVGFITSSQGSASSVTPPAGYTYYRKLPYGVVVYNHALMPNHVASWPIPRVTFTYQVQVASFFSSVTWAPINLSKLIPENARLGSFRFVITGAGSNVWLAPTASSQYAKLLAYNQQGVTPSVDMRVDGSETVYVMFQPGAGGRLDVYLDGFSITEATD